MDGSSRRSAGSLRLRGQGKPGKNRRRQNATASASGVVRMLRCLLLVFALVFLGGCLLEFRTTHYHNVLLFWDSEKMYEAHAHGMQHGPETLVRQAFSVAKQHYQERRQQQQLDPQPPMMQQLPLPNQRGPVNDGNQQREQQVQQPHSTQFEWSIFTAQLTKWRNKIGRGRGHLQVALPGGAAPQQQEWSKSLELSIPWLEKGIFRRRRSWKLMVTVLAEDCLPTFDDNNNVGNKDANSFPTVQTLTDVLTTPYAEVVVYLPQTPTSTMFPILSTKAQQEQHQCHQRLVQNITQTFGASHMEPGQLQIVSGIVNPLPPRIAFDAHHWLSMYYYDSQKSNPDDRPKEGLPEYLPKWQRQQMLLEQSHSLGLDFAYAAEMASTAAQSDLWLFLRSGTRVNATAVMEAGQLDNINVYKPTVNSDTTDYAYQMIRHYEEHYHEHLTKFNGLVHKLCVMQFWDEPYRSGNKENPIAWPQPPSQTVTKKAAAPVQAKQRRKLAELGVDEIAKAAIGGGGLKLDAETVAELEREIKLSLEKLQAQQNADGRIAKIKEAPPNLEEAKKTEEKTAPESSKKGEEKAEDLPTKEEEKAEEPPKKEEKTAESKKGKKLVIKVNQDKPPPPPPRPNPTTPLPTGILMETSGLLRMSMILRSLLPYHQKSLSGLLDVYCYDMLWEAQVLKPDPLIPVKVKNPQIYYDITQMTPDDYWRTWPLQNNNPHPPPLFAYDVDNPGTIPDEHSTTKTLLKERPPLASSQAIPLEIPAPPEQPPPDSLVPAWVSVDNTQVGPHKTPQPSDSGSEKLVTFVIPTGTRPNGVRNLYVTRSLNQLLPMLKKDFAVIQGGEVKGYSCVVLLVICGNIPSELNDHRSGLEEYYGPEIEAGLIQIVSTSLDMYPTFAGIRNNYNDPEMRIRWRSKQNVDIANAFWAAKRLAKYIMLLEDDTGYRDNFASELKERLLLDVKEESAKPPPVDVLKKLGMSDQDEFAPYVYPPVFDTQDYTDHSFAQIHYGFGYSGVLLHDDDALTYAVLHFVLMDEMPCDLFGFAHHLQGHSLDHKFRYQLKKVLLTHLGKTSSLEGKVQPVWGNLS